MSIASRLVVALPLLALLGAASPPAPTITSGSIVTPSIDVTKPPPAPKITLHIEGAASSVMFNWTGPSGQTLNSWFVGNTWQGTTTFQATNTTMPANGFELAFNLYTQPGSWTLSNVQLCTPTQMCTTYSGSTLTAVFGKTALQITNPNTPDTEAPTATRGSIGTTSISLGQNPILSVSLRASDNLSGVYQASIAATTPGQFNPVYAGTATFAAPSPSGVFKLTSSLASNTPTGTYTITSIYVQDYAGNTLYVSDAATISKIFGGHDSFTVGN